MDINTPKKGRSPVSARIAESTGGHTCGLVAGRGEYLKTDHVTSTGAGDGTGARDETYYNHITAPVAGCG